jgi:hypothetical protein
MLYILAGSILEKASLVESLGNFVEAVKTLV